MPYHKDSEVPDYVPKANRRQWREIWNSEYDTRKKNGASDEEAELRAYEAANAKAGPNAKKEAAVPDLQFRKTINFFRMIEKADGTHVVDGICTSERPDHDDEIADYEGTLAAIKTWSDDQVAKTSVSGQEISLGNIRVQHDSKQIGGKVIGISPNDADKAVTISTQPLKKVFDELIYPGMVTGFSIAGRYVKREPVVIDGKTYTRYTPEISEISYVDRPCNPDAAIQYVKADGTNSLMKWRQLRDEAAAAQGGTTVLNKDELTVALRETLPGVLESIGFTKEKKTKRVAGEDLTADCFAYVGDKDDTSTWKLPIKFSTDEKTKSHIRNALARFNQTQGIPAGEKSKVKAKIVAAAKKHGIEASEKSAKAVRAAMVTVITSYAGEDGAQAFERAEAERIVTKVYEVLGKADGKLEIVKGMYTVARLAGMLQDFQYLVASTEYERDVENDESDVPDDLRDVLETLVPVFVSMASEEASELLAQTKTAAEGGQGGTSMEKKDDIQNADLLKAAKGLAGHLKATAKYHMSKAKHHESHSEDHEKLSELHEEQAAKCMKAAKEMTENEKAVTDELAKLNKNDDAEKIFDVLAKSKNAMAGYLAASGKHHLKKAKAHGKMSDLHDDHAELHKSHAAVCEKAAVDIGSAEQAPDPQGRSKDDAAAHPGGSSEKADQPELVKALSDALKPLQDSMKKLQEDQDALKKAVDQKLEKLDEGPVEKARKAVLDDKHKNGEQGISLGVSSKETAPGVGIFSN